MRVIDAFDESVRTVAVSPDGRFLAAATGYDIAVFAWNSGEPIVQVVGNASQLAFTTDGEWMVMASGGGMARWTTAARAESIHISPGNFSGGISVFPNGRTFVATRAGLPQHVKLEEWELPVWRSKKGIDLWSPFVRLAVSPNGEHIAGISREIFELRYAESGGLNRREEPPCAARYLPARLRRGIQREEPPEYAYVTFPRHSDTVVYGWDNGFFVMETRAGSVIKRIPATEDHPFLDAVFLGSGHQLATVDGTPLMRVWSADSWTVAHSYDWNTGGLTCITATADGLAGVCGTDTGKLVVFDVDE